MVSSITGRDVFKRGNAEEWTAARIGELTVQEIKQLRDNAERLNEPGVVELCRVALQDARSSRARALRKAGTGAGAGTATGTRPPRAKTR
jgi:hypothetical protein